MVGAAMRNAGEQKIVFDFGTARRHDSCERSERDGLYGATDELRYELVAVERDRNASFASLKSMRCLIGSQCNCCNSVLEL